MPWSSEAMPWRNRYIFSLLLKFSHFPNLEILGDLTLNIYPIVLRLRIEFSKRDRAIDWTQKNRLVKLDWHVTLTVEIIQRRDKVNQ